MVSIFAQSLSYCRSFHNGRHWFCQVSCCCSITCAITCIDPMLSTRPMSSVVNPSGFLARIPDILMVYLARFLFSDHSLCLLPVCFQCFLCLCLWRPVHVNGYQLWLLNSGFVLPHRLSRLPTWTVGFVHEGQWSDNHSLPCNGTWLF